MNKDLYQRSGSFLKFVLTHGFTHFIFLVILLQQANSRDVWFICLFIKNSTTEQHKEMIDAEVGTLLKFSYWILFELVFLTLQTLVAVYRLYLVQNTRMDPGSYAWALFTVFCTVLMTVFSCLFYMVSFVWTSPFLFIGGNMLSFVTLWRQFNGLAIMASLLHEHYCAVIDYSEVLPLSASP